MAFDGTPWFVGGGAHHTPEVARLLAYAATSGAEGVVEPGSLKVVAASVANDSVVVRPGAALVLNRYAGSSGGQQTYVVRNPESTPISIPATGSTGGRTDAIVARVLDPQYEGSAPADPLTFQYSRPVRIASVPSNLTDVKQLGLSYPAVLLARVNIPASTATITNGMITDLRQVAIPRRQTELRTYALTSGEGNTLATEAAYPDGQTFPTEASETNPWYLDIPEWATRMKIVLTWSGIIVPAGDVWGWMWVQVGRTVHPQHFVTQGVRYDTSGSKNQFRMPHIVADQKVIPREMRGTSQQIYPRGNVVGKSGTGARLRLDAGSALVLQVEFMEQAD